MDFHHGDRVRHRHWTDSAGRQVEGTIFTYQALDGCPGGTEVRWDDTFVSDELALVGSELDLI